MPSLEEAYKMAYDAYSNQNLPKAENICVQVLQQVPDHKETTFLLGHIKKDKRELDQARSIFEKLRKEHPENADILSSLGALEEEVGRYTNALSFYKQSLNINPDHGATQFLYATMLEKTNQLEQAHSFIKPLLKNNPPAQMHLLHAAILQRQKKQDEALNVLEKLSDTKLNEKSQIQKYFLMGKCHDFLASYEKAYSCFTQAHSIKQPQNSQETKKEKEKKNSFLKEIEDYETIIKQKKSSGSKNNPAQTKKPIPQKEINIHFMVGFPRSGTTLLHHMLDAHPEIEVISEFPLIRFLLNKMKEQYGSDILKIPELTSQQLLSIQQAYINFLKEYLDKYDNHQSFSATKTYIDKLPLNIIHASFIQKIFPKAKFILSLRHPCDSTLSNFMQNYQPNPAMDNMYSLENIAYTYKKSFDLFFTAKKNFSLEHIEIRYEDLLVDFEMQTHKICDFLNVKYSQDISNYHSKLNKNKDINTPSYQQVIKPIYKDSQERWKNYEKEFKAGKTLSFLKKYKEKFGYA